MTHKWNISESVYCFYQTLLECKSSNLNLIFSKQNIAIVVVLWRVSFEWSHTRLWTMGFHSFTSPFPVISPLNKLQLELLRKTNQQWSANQLVWQTDFKQQPQNYILPSQCPHRNDNKSKGSYWCSPWWPAKASWHRPDSGSLAVSLDRLPLYPLTPWEGHMKTN